MLCAPHFPLFVKSAAPQSKMQANAYKQINVKLMISTGDEPQSLALSSTTQHHTATHLMAGAALLYKCPGGDSNVLIPTTVAKAGIAISCASLCILCISHTQIQVGMEAVLRVLRITQTQ